MKINEIIKNYFIRLFVCFSLVVIGFCVVASAIGNEKGIMVLAIPSVWTFLAYSAMFSLSFTIASFIRNSVVIKRCVQFLLSFASLGIILPGNTFVSEGQNPAFRILLIALMFIIIYTLCALILFVFKYFSNMSTNRYKDYDSIFEEQKNN